MAVWTVTLTILDAKGQSAKHRIYLPLEALTDIDNVLADPVVFAQNYALEIEPLIDGAITAISLSVGVPLLAGHKAAPLENSDVEEGAVFKFLTADGVTFQHRIPTFKESLLEDNSNAVDFAAVAAVSWYELMMAQAIDTPGNFLIDPTDARGADIIDSVSGEQNFKRSRR